MRKETRDLFYLNEDENKSNYGYRKVTLIVQDGEKEPVRGELVAYQKV